MVAVHGWRGYRVGSWAQARCHECEELPIGTPWSTSSSVDAARESKSNRNFLKGVVGNGRRCSPRESVLWREAPPQCRGMAGDEACAHAQRYYEGPFGIPNSFELRWRRRQLAHSTSRIEIELQTVEALVRNLGPVARWIVMTWLHEANSESFASKQGRDVLKGAFGMTK